MLLRLVKRLQKYQQAYFYSFCLSKTTRSTQYSHLSKASKNKRQVDSESKLKWYEQSQLFWKNTPCSIEGVMMGRADLNNIDIQASSSFIEKVSSKRTDFNNESVLDCGAGIGRVCSHLLRHRFKSVDMLEKSREFVAAAMKENTLNGYRHFYCSGLQNFTFEHKYDAIWVQWVLTHLHDQEIVAFLERAKSNVRRGGCMFIKENFCQNDSQIMDNGDCTIVRSNFRWKSLFYAAKCKIFDVEIQLNWPSDLYPVKMWALI